MLTLIGAFAPIVWGTTYFVTTEMLPSDRPITAAVIRALPAGVILLAVTREKPQQWHRLIVLSGLNIGLFFPLLFISAYHLPGGLAAIVGAAQPLLVAGLSLMIGLSRTPRRQVLCGVVAVAGVWLTVAGNPLHFDPLGICAAVLGTVSMAAGITLTRAWGAPGGVSGLAATGWQLTLGGLMMIPLIPLLDTGQFEVTGKAIGGYLWLSIPGSLIAYSLWFYAGRRLPSTSTSLLGLLSPVTAACIGWFALGQRLELLQIIGFALALAASVAGQWAGRKGIDADSSVESRTGGRPA